MTSVDAYGYDALQSCTKPTKPPAAKDAVDAIARIIKQKTYEVYKDAPTYPRKHPWSI